MLRDRIVEMDPQGISPFHEEVYPEKTQRIYRRMSRHGWEGRPLVVMELPDGTMKAITGSHRLRAALAAELRRIPVIQLDDQERDALVDAFEFFDEDRQELWKDGSGAPDNQSMAYELYEISPAVADLIVVDDYEIKQVTEKLVDRLLDEGISEEVVELL